ELVAYLVRGDWALACAVESAPRRSERRQSSFLPALARTPRRARRNPASGARPGCSAARSVDGAFVPVGLGRATLFLLPSASQTDHVQTDRLQKGGSYASARRSAGSGAGCPPGAAGELRAATALEQQRARARLGSGAPDQRSGCLAGPARRDSPLRGRTPGGVPGRLVGMGAPLSSTLDRN